MRQRLLLHGKKHGGRLRLIGFHELHARGGVIKQVAHQNRCALRAACGRFLRDLPRVQMQAHAGAVFRLGQKINPADCRDGSERFAAEAERRDGGKVVFIADFAGCMAQKRCARVLGGHAAAVVGNADEGHAAVLDFDGDARCARVNGVFHQLLDDGGGAFNHLACGNQVRNVGAELDNFRHGNLLLQVQKTKGHGVDQRVQRNGRPDGAGFFIDPRQRDRRRNIWQTAEQDGQKRMEPKILPVVHERKK